MDEMVENLERANRSIKRSTERNATQRDVVVMNVKGREVVLGIGVRCI
jgi:hypothetical protein